MSSDKGIENGVSENQCDNQNIKYKGTSEKVCTINENITRRIVECVL